MDASMWQFVPVGARITGPQPVDDVWIPMPTGVHAYYGLNGAGKSRLLAALADLLSCRGDGYVVVRAVVNADLSFTPYRSLVDLLNGDARQAGTPETTERSEPARPHQWMARSELERVVGHRIWNAAWQYEINADQFSEEVDEVVRQRLFALTPSPDRLTWEVNPATLIDGSTPALQADANRIIQARQIYLAKTLPGLNQPFPANADELDGLADLFNEALQAADVKHGGSLLSTVSPLFDATRDAYLDDFGVQTAWLAEAALTPYRLGGAFDTLDKLCDLPARPLASVHRSDTHSIAATLEQTAEAIESALPLKEVVGEGGKVSAQFVDFAESRSAAASDSYGHLLHDAPRLELQIEPPWRWFAGQAFRWRAFDHGHWLDISDLSEAQLRWALVAIDIAMAGELPSLQTRFTNDWLGKLPRLLVLDEPDAALHVTAQRYAVEGLVRIAARDGLAVLCATHSREFLNAPDVHLHHVSRGLGDSVVVSSMPELDSMDLDEIGLTAADLFLLHRVLLLVEGHHEKIIFEELFGSELSAAGVLLVPLHGGKNLSKVVDAQVLAQFSDAPVVAVLDDLRQNQVDAFWAEMSTTGADARDSVVRKHFQSNSLREAESFLINFARATTNEPSRFQVVGMSKPDIPEYLPVEAIVPTATTWEQLRSEFSAQTKYTNFKAWATAKRGADYSDDRLRLASQSLDSLPEDFIRMLNLCIELSRRPRQVS